MITKQTSEAGSIVALSDVYNEWGGSFDYIHTAAALMQFAKLSRGREDSRVLQALTAKWLQLLPGAGARASSNTLWACSNLGRYEQQQVSAMWGPTWEVFKKQIESELQGEPGQAPLGEVLRPQPIASSIDAAAKLRKQLGADELQLLVRAFLRPDVLAAAKPQEMSNVLWALSKLSAAWLAGGCQ